MTILNFFTGSEQSEIGTANLYSSLDYIIPLSWLLTELP